MFGWMGKILQVNLTTGKIDHILTQPYTEKYLGGRGIAARIYWDTVKPEITAFDPENRLIFMTGPLVGTGAQAATQLSVVGKSPMTYPEGYCYGSLGGFVGAELKKSGFDGLIVEGRSPQPVYLWIHNGEAEIRDASALWGQNGYRTGELLQQSHGEKTRYISIGVAGERLVRIANALASNDCTLSAGFGAVMGSKKLKAIAILGDEKINVAHRERLQELSRYAIQISKRMDMTVTPRLMETGKADLLEVIGKGACHLCGFKCISGIFRYGKRLVGHRKCQSVEYYLPWVYGHDEEPLETFFEAPVLANDYGFDSWQMEAVVEWLWDCYRGGALTEEETGLPLSKIGTREFLDKLLHAIAYREGFGDILAEGPYRVRDSGRISEKARSYFRYNLAPIGRADIFQPRKYVVYSLLYFMEPRIHHINLHEPTFVNGAWFMNIMQPGSTGITSEVVRKIARAFWGSEEAGSYSTYEGKALMAKMVLNRTYTKEILGLCDFAWPILYSFNTPDRVGDPELIGNIFEAVTGLSKDTLDLYAERLYNVQRIILLREGRLIPEADYPFEYNFTEPLAGKPGEPLLVVGPNGEPRDMTGNTLDRGKYLKLLKEYYQLRGWDETTGRPLAETLISLGLDDLVTAVK